ncbi:hypothetical protein CYJ70_04415 [Gardnerella pickettii]|uniref:Uncharacterized protein n=1 Tax=Gardnerella pickettii TaxID=2914924 RepID=A0ABX4SHW7_9BIFI|nr:hypothetical protein CYJ70_04415 [Gardnerella pickettii]
MSLAQISCAHVFAAQKQCFCLELLSAQNCLRALRFKRSGRLARAAISSRSADLACKVHWTLHLSQITL